MTKSIIVVKVPCKLLYVIQVKEFLIKCSTSWPYLILEFLVAYITIVASDWPRTFFTPKVFLFSILFINKSPSRKPTNGKQKHVNTTKQEKFKWTEIKTDSELRHQEETAVHND